MQDLTLCGAMLRLRKLYTEPPTFDAIEFEDGVNLILGEKDDTSNKTNGVGKSLCIEFVNFALLKRFAGSRLSGIPQDAFPHSTKVCLDFVIDGDCYAVKRSIENESEPELIGPSGPLHFNKIEDAVDFLTQRLFSDVSEDHPSFRIMMGPLIRDERSEFKSLIQCYDTRLRMADNFEPHLYLFGVSLSDFGTVKEALKDIEVLSNDSRRVKSNVKLLRGAAMKDARSELNELDRQVAEIQKGIDAFENLAGYDSVRDDLTSLEADIERWRRQRSILRFQLKRLKPIDDSAKVGTEELVEFYNQISRRLGEEIRRDLEEVQAFKRKIDDFQNRLLGDRRAALAADLKEANETLVRLDAKYRSYLAVLDQGGNFRNLRQTYAAHKKKSDEAAELRTFVERYDQLEADKQRAKSKKERALLEFQLSVQGAHDVISAFEDYVLSMHEFIQGNRKASFAINVLQTKQVVEFDMRIDDDGSRSNEREKVFMYDTSLLLCSATAARHPGFLIHDNIFDVDDDTLKRSLEFLLNGAVFGSDQQYILTLNSDHLDHMDLDPSTRDEIESSIRARFTKTQRFLKIKYQELRSK